MKNFAILCVFLNVMILCLAASNNTDGKCALMFPDPFSASSKDYRYQSEWGGLVCDSGKEQSPIAIENKDVSWNDRLSPLKFHNFDQPQKLLVQNAGLLVRAFLKRSKEPRPAISGGGLDGKYLLSALYFLWPNEHIINKNRADFGIVFVFYSEEYRCYENSAHHYNSRAFVNIGYNLEKEHGPPAFDALAKAVKEVARCPNATTQTAPCDDVNLNDLLPELKNGFYRYQGSMPAPDCWEGILTYVLEDTGTIGINQFQTIREIYNLTGYLVSFAARNPQPLYNRTIIHGNFNNKDDWSDKKSNWGQKEKCDDCEN